jgi:hypothetical protein
MPQLEQETQPSRVPLGAFVDAAQHEQLVALDRSVSSVVRRAIEAELDRSCERAA